jgi:tyrosyl-DNA phosphodiesterase 2
MAGPQLNRWYEPNRGLFDPSYTPKVQPCYEYTDGVWCGVTKTSAASGLIQDSSMMRLLTWNIDVLWGGGDIRMQGALEVLMQEVDSCNEPVVVLLQEMTISDLKLIMDSQWIQDRFYITDISNANWADERYGTSTLVDKKLAIEQAFRIHYDSRFGRDALFVDISVVPAQKPSSTAEEQRSLKTLRIANTHLESLIANPPLRPAQVAASAGHLHAPRVHAGVLAGDFNAIQDFDRTLHQENKLNDTYLVHGGLEDSTEGYTWGYQCEEELMQRFGPSRMDKILYYGHIKVDGLKRIGIGAKVNEANRTELKAITNGLEWITDHYGLAATLAIMPQEIDEGAKDYLQ